MDSEHWQSKTRAPDSSRQLYKHCFLVEMRSRLQDQLTRRVTANEREALLDLCAMLTDTMIRNAGEMKRTQRAA